MRVVVVALLAAGCSTKTEDPPAGSGGRGGAGGSSGSTGGSRGGTGGSTRPGNRVSRSYFLVTSSKLYFPCEFGEKPSTALELA